jgi:RND family efflux transporter MFP subunit
MNMGIDAMNKWGWVVVLAGAMAACSRTAPPAEPVRAVKVITVGTQAQSSSLEFAGEVRARVESSLGFRLGGKLLERSVELGQRVKAGQLLARLDPQDFKLAADAANAQLATARTNHALAAADFKRYQALKDQNFISGAELERREAALQAASAQLDQAQAQFSIQGNQAGYTSLNADVAGVVTAVLAERGQVVAAGAPVLHIAQDGVRDVVFSVPEDKVAAIRLGTEVEIRPWSTPGILKGTIREVAASADPATRTFAVKVAVPAHDALALGSTVTVLPKALQRTGAPVIKLPTSALRQEGQTTAVWVLDAASMTVKSQSVQIASADGNDVVVAGGLQPGMQVVVTGVHVLAAGQKVSLYKADKPS